MNNPHVIPVRKRIKFTTAILFAVAIIMVTSTFNRVILTLTTVVAQTQQLNSPSQGTNSSSSNPLSLNTIFKQVDLQCDLRQYHTHNFHRRSSSSITEEHRDSEPIIAIQPYN